MRTTLAFFLNFPRLVTLLLLDLISNVNLGSNFPLSPRMSDSGDTSSLKTIDLDGYFSFDDVQTAATDFGNSYHFLPSAILHPKSTSDISKTVKHVYDLGPTSKLTIAARGHAHSVQGQAQALGGVVINMESLRGTEVHVFDPKFPFIDVSGGELWINILHESLKHGLAPKSWTDYLYLTVGGTLSNAGISGQTFRHGPQISNVYQLEVVTGRGERVSCSKKQNADLFYGVLGGLGQFGIITRARIALEPAPRMVKWIRVLYSDFSLFIKDQEMLISAENSFDYIEGFVIINRTGLLNSWRSSFNPRDKLKASQFISEGRTLYCLEMTKNFNLDETDTLNQEVESLVSRLSFIPSMIFLSEVSYFDFLDRVHVSEKTLRSKGLWEVPHPWLNLFIPRTKIHYFAAEVFSKILTDGSSGPILIYPVNKSKWDNRTSAVIPDEDVFYLVAFLSSPSTFSPDSGSLELILARNKRILDFCESAGIGMKQYLPYYTQQEEWKAHFGPRWEDLIQRKRAYDPLAILAPGQRIFPKAS